MAVVVAAGIARPLVIAALVVVDFAVGHGLARPLSECALYNDLQTFNFLIAPHFDLVVRL